MLSKYLIQALCRFARSSEFDSALAMEDLGLQPHARHFSSLSAIPRSRQGVSFSASFPLCASLLPSFFQRNGPVHNEFHVLERPKPSSSIVGVARKLSTQDPREVQFAALASCLAIAFSRLPGAEYVEDAEPRRYAW